jgi:hypothetical protein
VDSFKGSEKIVLNEGDQFVSHRFHLTKATTADGKGFLPYGTDATSVTCFIFDSDSTSVTDIIVESVSISSNIITLSMSYPENQLIPGQYTIRFTVGLDNGSTILNCYFSRLYLLAGLDTG